VRTLTDIKLELDRATARRSELWEELRIARTRTRFGSPELIVRRAEIDKRLERELERRRKAA
jgi:hypothetical protein